MKVMEITSEAARARNGEISPFDLARFQLGLGNKEQALDTLERAYVNGRRYTQFVWLKRNPDWGPLREEPRFKELLRKVGLPE
jgi:hypothetical protein